MTSYCDTTTKSRFDAAVMNYEAANAAAASVEPFTACHVRDSILTIVENATDTLFNTPALSLGAVAVKLEKLYGEQLFDETDYYADYRRTLIGDLRRIERILLGFEEPEASGGMDLVRIDHDWTEARREHSHWEQLLEEGQSDASGQSKRSDIVALMDEAEANLLSAHSPHLNAVIKKLELLTEHSNDLGERTAQLMVLRDLHRFVTSQKD